MRLGGMHEACGVAGAVTPGRQAARPVFFGLFALQHRGQEAAGIASSDGRAAYIHKGLGRVAQVFDEDNLRPLAGELAIGHNRYSTTGATQLRNAQPHLVETVLGPLAVAHNGNLTNARALRRELLEAGIGFSSGSDTEVILRLLALPAEGSEDPWIARIGRLMARAEGAYALVLLTREAIYALRDPWGFRPLVVGELEGGGWAAASESSALATMGARPAFEVEPGSVVRIDREGYRVHEVAAGRPRALCVFEYVYFARPDTVLAGREVHAVRRRLGAELAREAPADADVVVGVPDSATAHALGYAEAAGLPFAEGLIKNRYIGRTFIEPDDALRKTGVRLKYTPLASVLADRRVVLVDDSIVRGNTAGPLVRLLREAGAREVHLRVASPPVRHPCFMGLDMATHDELIAHRLELEAIRAHVGADSLAYLSHAGMLRAVGTRTGLCDACFSGRYPLAVEPAAPEEDALVGEG
ncbi:amidophosphoribosyltransferase [Oceanithermus profundus DSM 14977]|uniref:Amidophosphoribosyltransferase n=1 Tax=Oceanithermus profundus (strain DSM 14977 / NBRC 100410 / VKM B-2274 / 506) TaxID=670487 RepID=E4U461_OCEP5|nr:amidophosphoribosyltransferase [Oceanithermus profundus]ADR36146.1 amidophosphoribosyltransferase [Oceanithermus profundus DSM 14977]